MDQAEGCAGQFDMQSLIFSSCNSPIDSGVSFLRMRKLRLKKG